MFESIDKAQQNETFARLEKKLEKLQIDKKIKRLQKQNSLLDATIHQHCSILRELHSACSGQRKLFVGDETMTAEETLEWLAECIVLELEKSSSLLSARKELKI